MYMWVGGLGIKANCRQDGDVSPYISCCVCECVFKQGSREREESPSTKVCSRKGWNCINCLVK